MVYDSNGIIHQRKEGLTHHAIGYTIVWSREKVSQHAVRLDQIVITDLDFASLFKVGG